MKTLFKLSIVLMLLSALILAEFAPKIAISQYDNAHQHVTNYALYLDGEEVGGIDLFTEKVFYCEIVGYSHRRRPCKPPINREIFSLYVGSRG